MNWDAIGAIAEVVGAAAVIIVICLLTLARTDAYSVGLIATAAVGLMMGGFWTIAYRIFGATPNPDRNDDLALLERLGLRPEVAPMPPASRSAATG